VTRRKSPYSTPAPRRRLRTRSDRPSSRSSEPAAGHDRAYNRWYEDDHYYSGAMAMPWMFAGRRWVATQNLQALRYPDPSAIAQPLNAGKYLATYWITEGRYEDHLRWTVATNQRLLPDHRIFLDRTHVYTSFQHYRRLRCTGDASGPATSSPLDHPYEGLVLEVARRPAGCRPRRLDRWLRTEHSRPPRRLPGGDDPRVRAHPLARGPNELRRGRPRTRARLTLLTRTETPPASRGRRFRGDRRRRWPAPVSAGSSWPPRPADHPGTDTYVDELR